MRRGSRGGSFVAAVCFSCRYLPRVFELIVVRDLNYVSEKRVPLLDYAESWLARNVQLRGVH